MEILALLLITVPTVAFLSYFLKFRSELSLVVLAPLSVIILLTLAINLSETPPVLTYSHLVPVNQTVVGNSTLIEYGQIVERFPIDFFTLQLINLVVGTGSIIMGFLTLRRVFQARRSNDE